MKIPKINKKPNKQLNKNKIMKRGLIIGLIIAVIGLILWENYALIGIGISLMIIGGCLLFYLNYNNKE